MAVIIIVGLLTISFYLFHQFKDKIARWGKEGAEAHEEMVRIINHSVGGLKEMQVIGCASYFEVQMEKQIRKAATSSSSAMIFSNLPRYVIESFLITFLIVFTFLFIALNKNNSQNLTSVLGIFALASIRLLPAAGNLLTSVNGIKYHAYSLDKLYFDLKELDSLNRPYSNNLFHDNNQPNNNRQTFSFTDRIVMKDLVYRYPNSERNAIEKVSITIQKGQSIGLIGKSGAGKTTLVDVVLGLLTPQYGDIIVDNASIYTNLRHWQNMIGYVPQSIFLIDDTLEKNIAFGIPREFIDCDRLKKAIEAAQLSELVAQLPNGINTMVGERGILLSGGQRQRVGIARALYHEREILVFDEATAALDNETERLVTEAIESLGGIKTMIIIAHRLSTIEHCDCIYMMQGGQIIKSGNYREVVLKK
ncbi:MAG: ATP-binding cassette domain-containing protein [Chroococcidiopsidaceae cyanobacterium CP_BM_RX_35]|nr:ATP-binding cassette domain-containing protein [Chroococcidiopsidaceae cyanobacterium CP_BM_RX_35]